MPMEVIAYIPSQSAIIHHYAQKKSYPWHAKFIAKYTRNHWRRRTNRVSHKGTCSQCAVRVRHVEVLDIHRGRNPYHVHTATEDDLGEALNTPRDASGTGPCKHEQSDR